MSERMLACNIVTMSVSARMLLPFAPTYRKLNLSARWWHRLAVVLFSTVVALTLAISVGVPLIDAIDARKSALADAYDKLADAARKETVYLDPKTGERIEPDFNSGLVPKSILPSDFVKTIVITVSGKRNSFPGDATDAEIVAAICANSEPAPASCWEVVNEQPSKTASPALPNTANVVKPSNLVTLAKETHPIPFLRIIGVAVLITLGTSYFLQALYRAVIFVGFGDPLQTE